MSVTTSAPVNEQNAFQYFLLERRGPVLDAWINRPEARNALSFPVDHEWEKVLDLAEADPEVHVVTLRGKGPVFSAGHDLKEVAEGYVNRDPSKGTDWENRRPSLPRSWYFPKTIIAGVHGYVGPAAQRMLAPIDLILAAKGTRFSFEQARMGSGDPGGNILAFQLPMRVIKQMWLMGGWFDADTAMQMHYVQRVTAPEDLDEEVNKWADSAAGLDPLQVAVYKEGIRRIYEIKGLLGVIGIGNKSSGHVSSQDREFFQTLLDSGMKEALKLRQTAVDASVTEVR